MTVADVSHLRVHISLPLKYVGLALVGTIRTDLCISWIDIDPNLTVIFIHNLNLERKKKTDTKKKRFLRSFLFKYKRIIS